jgi:hypothetical protein
MWRSIGLQSEFAERVLALRKPTLLVLTNGGPLAIDPLVHTTRQNIIAGPAAIIEAFNPNTHGATALAKLVFGHECRWGKLPYTVYPASYARLQDPANFDMSKAPGRSYKYYTGTPLFPFGNSQLPRFNVRPDTYPVLYQSIVSHTHRVLPSV